MSARADRRLALIAGALLALVFTGWAAFGIAGWSVGSVTRSEHRVLGAGVSELHLVVGSGDVTVSPTGGDRVVVDSRVSGSLHAPALDLEVHGDEVDVRGGCRSFGLGRCHAEVDVRVPPGTAVALDADSGGVRVSGLAAPVTVHGSSGDVELDGLTGGADVRLASGDIVVDGLAGKVMLDTSAGDILARDLRARTVIARAASGDVVASFAAAPADVDATSASGDVKVLLPRGDGAAYRVDAGTDSGDRAVTVRTDPLADRAVRVQADSGDVVVGYGG